MNRYPLKVWRALVLWLALLLVVSIAAGVT